MELNNLISFDRNVNDDIMEMLIFAYACRTSSARKIVGVMPYLPYSKQCKMRKRGSVVCKLVASMIATAGTEIIYFCLCDILLYNSLVTSL